MKNTLTNNKAKKKIIADMIRVNQAGEFGAQKIYEGQLEVFKDDKIIQKMANQEQIHLVQFSGLDIQLYSPSINFLMIKVFIIFILQLLHHQMPKVQVRCLRLLL